MSKAGLLVLLVIITGVLAAAYLGMLPVKLPTNTSPQTETGETSIPDQTEAMTTSTQPATLPAEEPETTSTSVNEEQTVSKTSTTRNTTLPANLNEVSWSELENAVLAARESKLEELGRVTAEQGPVIVTAENATNMPWLAPIIAYYEKVKAENLDFSDVIDMNIVENASLVEMHKALYQSFDLLNYTITLYSDKYFEERQDLVPEGYDRVWIVRYLFTGTFVDREGNSWTSNVSLVSFIGVNDTTGKTLLLQTLPIDEEE